MAEQPKQLDQRWARFLRKTESGLRKKYVITGKADSTSAFPMTPTQAKPELKAAKEKHDLKYRKTLPAPGGKFIFFLYKDV